MPDPALRTPQAEVEALSDALSNQQRATARFKAGAEARIAALETLAADRATQIARLSADAALKRRRPGAGRPLRPSYALEKAYQRKIAALTAEMHKSVMFWLKSAYRNNEPVVTEIATDALPALELQRAIRRLARRWQRNINDASLGLAKWFGLQVYQRSARDLQRILREGGWTVDLKLTRAQRDVLVASIAANVALIRSIPSKYFSQIEGMVMRSVQTGRDLQQLTRDLQKNYAVTRKRAILIARDQNNKASAALSRARFIELNIEEAIWVHSHAGKEPRPTHVANSGKKYNVKTGWYDPHEKKWIHPGELINCRCFSRPVIPGFS